MHRDVVSLGALDFVLGIALARTMHMPFVVNGSGVNLDDHAADVSRFGIPGHVITHSEFLGHKSYLDLSASGSGARIKCRTSGCYKLHGAYYAGSAAELHGTDDDVNTNRGLCRIAHIAAGNNGSLQSCQRQVLIEGASALRESNTLYGVLNLDCVNFAKLAGNDCSASRQCLLVASSTKFTNA